MFITYIIVAALAGIIFGVAFVLFWQQISKPILNVYHQWLFKHKAVHPYKVQRQRNN